MNSETSQIDSTQDSILLQSADKRRGQIVDLRSSNYQMTSADQSAHFTVETNSAINMFNARPAQVKALSGRLPFSDRTQATHFHYGESLAKSKHCSPRCLDSQPITNLFNNQAMMTMSTIPLKAKSSALSKTMSRKVFDAAKTSPRSIQLDQESKKNKYTKHLNDHKR